MYFGEKVYFLSERLFVPLAFYDSCIYFRFRYEIVIPGITGGPVQNESGRRKGVKFWEQEGGSNRDSLVVGKEVFLISGVYKKMIYVGIGDYIVNLEVWATLPDMSPHFGEVQIVHCDLCQNGERPI